MPSCLRPFLSLLAAVSLVCPPVFAFQSPLSDESIREAYFLGQRRDESLRNFLDKYAKYLAAPKTGPYISSITFFTPFAVLTQQSSTRSAGYSAQQAQLDHRGQAESVKIIVQIQLTDSYSALIPRPTGSRSGSPTGYVPRPYDFWKDFDAQVFNGNDDKPLRPFTSSGEPNYFCADGGGCTLAGATLYFEFLADAFSSDSATVQVIPPEGDQVYVDFDLTSLR